MPSSSRETTDNLRGLRGGWSLNDPLVLLELKAQVPRGLLQHPGGATMYAPGDA